MKFVVNIMPLEDIPTSYLFPAVSSNVANIEGETILTPLNTESWNYVW